jgi:hypothetical protein
VSIQLILSKPVEGQDIPPTLTLGPFGSVHYEDGRFYGDGDEIAEVFSETIDDMMNVMGHPAAGAVFAPRTFHADESGDPEYPGKGYRIARFAAVTP